MHLFCPECGKHIDVSIEEIENLQGHLVCPQCLEAIEVEVKNKELEVTFDDNNDLPKQDEAATMHNSPPAIPPMPTTNSQPTAPPLPQPKAETKQQVTHVDDVMRYCKHCGTFLREGANFCPKCGKFVRVAVNSQNQRPQATRQQYSRPQQYSAPSSRNTNQQYTPSMATNSRKPTGNRRQDKKGNKPFSIFSIGGCLTITIIAVALFFIAYIVMGIRLEG